MVCPNDNDMTMADCEKDELSSSLTSHETSPQHSRGSKKLLKPVLTPATLSSTDSSRSMESPSSEADEEKRGSLENTFWMPLPSPSRPRLDPRYAERIAAETRRLHNQFQPPKRQLSEDDLMPPPGIARDSSIFRPSPVLTLSSSTNWFVGESESQAREKQERYFACDAGVSDRFIPSRATSSFHFNLWESPTESSQRQSRDDTSSDTSAATATPTSGTASSTSAHAQLLRSELLGEDRSFQENGAPPSTTSNRSGNNHFRFQSPRQSLQENINFSETSSIVTSFSLAPVRSPASQRLMAAPPKRQRRISKSPFKVLDAPALQDDFYLNLVDWSSQNVLAVGLGSCVYLWSACTSKVTKLCDLSSSEDLVTSVSWAQRGVHLAVGTNKGEVQLWDTIRIKKIRSMDGHSARVGALSWTGPILASGSRDRAICIRDVRVQSHYTDRLSNHKQEVCGLKWSFDEPAFLASGGNDNNLHVLDSRNPSQLVHTFSDHSAAVKAIAWSPHQHGLLASGGGTADRCIRFWNTLSGAALNKVDTGSQVCNLAWSQNCNEIVSTHGYSLNQIIVWRYPSMSKVATLTGHTYRVLYLAMSPDGSTVVTGAGDETLRFWQIFPGPRSDGKDSAGGLLFPNTPGSVIR